jgi:multisubunit Na+/H+ antiporter MnhF subunit
MSLSFGFFVLWTALFTALGAGLWRLSVGPTTLDRMLAFDLVSITIVALVVVFSAETESLDFIEFVLVLSALGFLTTVAYFYYLMQLSSGTADFIEDEHP